VGARVPVAELFSGIPWSTPAVFARTLERLGNRSHLLLAEHYDVDTAEDLETLRAELALLGPSIAPATRRALDVVRSGREQGT
jgi:glycosyltransferase A (GT-A) superfamily protein (DUF2064 family)